MEEFKTKLIVTDDGSHTLYQANIDETYHSTHGAIQESKFIFIDKALNYSAKSDIHILEIGFGTGLNTLLTYINVIETKKNIHYTTLELFPIDKNLIKELNFCTFEMTEYQGVFEEIHNAAWEVDRKLSSTFTLRKINTDFCKTKLTGKFDIVYFDAFSPEKQAEMWTLEQFRKIFESCNDGAILTTYCAKGYVRRNLINAGFSVERHPGPPGKREILRAIK